MTDNVKTFAQTMDVFRMNREKLCEIRSKLDSQIVYEINVPFIKYFEQFDPLVVNALPKFRIRADNLFYHIYRNCQKYSKLFK